MVEIAEPVATHTGESKRARGGLAGRWTWNGGVRLTRGCAYDDGVLLGCEEMTGVAVETTWT